jgi:serine protease inhibitor
MEGYIRKLVGTAFVLVSIATSCDVARCVSEEIPAPDPATISRVSSATDDFGFRLLKALAKDQTKNTIISPLGVSTAFAMAYNGAAGSTKKEMARTLALGSLGDDDINRANQYLMQTLAKADPAVQTEIANALWVQKDFPINPDFRAVCKSFYDADAMGLNFIGDPTGAAAEINSWADKHTHHRIPAIVAQVERETRMMLTDAVYFKGRWSSPFKAEDTGPRLFHLMSGASHDAAMMDQSGAFLYLENRDFQAIRVPYGNERYAMHVFLPRKMTGLPDFLRSLDEKHWTQWIGRFAAKSVEIVLPKFETTYGKTLNDSLKEIGMKLAFESRGANFSRIPLKPNRENALYINDVEHKTWVKVDEEGTEAAAATSMGFAVETAKGALLLPLMIVDHPFFFAISERQSGALLFAGVVTDPTLTGGAP